MNSNHLNNSIEIKNVNGANNSILKQEHLLNCLAELFHQIVTMKKKKGIMHPKKFIARLRKDNGELLIQNNRIECFDKEEIFVFFVIIII